MHFNSSMVRLREDLNENYLNLPKEFQFQYGAVKSEKFAPYDIVVVRFQFQYGAVKSF